MRHQNSVMHGLLKQVPWAAFDRLVEEHGADARVRRLTTKAQFVALLYGQLAGAASLREIETALSSHAARLYHLGGAEVPRSTLADANALRPAALFADLFAHMTGQARRGLKRKIGDAVRLIDSTGLRLAGLGSDWAHFSAKARGGKLHVVYDPDADRPLYAAVTPARVNDITAAKAMPIEAGATYVFDLGYYDYGWWAKLDQAGVIPDVFVRKVDDRWQVEISSSGIPRLSVNQRYAQLLRGNSDHAALRTQLQEARWLVRSLEIRNETLLKVAT